MMKRLCIYITYDPENIVDKYIGYMLQELHKVVAHLVVVCNYERIVRGMDHICPYADQIFYRGNTGFDAGAYKDALCQYIGWKTVCGYDELLLVNDSFYGPFYTLENLFEQMEKAGADYWGMTRCPKTELADGFTYQSHIQSYFFAFGKKVLQSRGFRDFWENMAYPASFMQAIIQYEIGINKFLYEAGFVGTAVMDLGSVRWNLRKNENPHMLYPLELIRDAGVPFLKRKSLILANRGFADAMGALKFIQNECGYDVSLIEEHLRRTGGDGTLLTLDKFIALIDILDELVIDNYQQELKLIKPCREIAEYCKDHPELNKRVTIVLRKPDEILTSRGGTAPNRKELVQYGKDRCILPFKQMVVRPDGKVSLCCNDAIGRYTLGDVNKESLLDIWYGSRFQMVRRCLYEGRENWGNCQFCDTFLMG